MKQSDNNGSGAEGGEDEISPVLKLGSHVTVDSRNFVDLGAGSSYTVVFIRFSGYVA